MNFCLYQVRRLGLDGNRKTSEPDMGSSSSAVHRSTDCIALQHKENASSSDSDLLRSAPPWVRPRFQFVNTQATQQPVQERSAGETSSSETSVSEPDAATLAAKKQKVSLKNALLTVFKMKHEFSTLL